MPNKEIEIKVLGIEKESLEKAVIDVGGKRLPDGLMIVRHFDYPDKRLRADGKLIRVRSIGETIVEFAYKGPKEESGRCKVRSEVQTLVDDAEVACAILKEVGLVETLYCEKKRTSYDVDGVHIDIDEYPGGICYAEIEGASEDEVYGMVEKLGLGDYEISCETAFRLFALRWPEVDICNLKFEC